MKEMRRFKQKMNEEEILEILDRNTHGVLSVVDEPYPYAVPVSYVREQSWIYFHCAKSGQKLDAILKNPHVCFCVVDDDTIVPEEFTTYFKSVIVFGKAEVIQDEAEKVKAFYALADKYSKNIEKSKTDKEIEGSKDAALIIKIQIEEMSGKKAIEYV